MGLACRDRCEAAVRRLIAAIDTNVRYSPASKSLVATSRRSGMISAGFIGLIGVMFLLWSYWYEAELGFMSILGLACVLYGGVQFIRMSRLTSVEDK